MHESISDQLINSLVNAYKQVRIGDPLDPNTLMGPLIDKSAITDYKNAIDKAIEQGGKLICGGNELDRPGCFVEPTLIEVNGDMDIVKEETFAPIFMTGIHYKTPKLLIGLEVGSRVEKKSIITSFLSKVAQKNTKTIFASALIVIVVSYFGWVPNIV